MGTPVAVHIGVLLSVKLVEGDCYAKSKKIKSYNYIDIFTMKLLRLPKLFVKHFLSQKCETLQIKIHPKKFISLTWSIDGVTNKKHFNYKVKLLSGVII